MLAALLVVALATASNKLILPHGDEPHPAICGFITVELDLGLERVPPRQISRCISNVQLRGLLAAVCFSENLIPG
jgi:hypothetical protein